MSKRTSKKAGATGRIPVIELPAACFGPLGVTLGRLPDAGGSDGGGLQSIPRRVVAWMDERQTCLRVLQFVHHEQLPDLASCPQYRAGDCTRGARGTPCAFREDADAAIWRKAAQWKYDPISGSVVVKELWAEFGLTGGVLP